MPVYNCEKYVEQAISSVLSQTFSDFELLVYDDASTDGTLERIEQFCSDSRMRLKRFEVNRGYLEVCNQMFEESCGELLTFLDADDIMHPERLMKMTELFERDSTLLGAGCNVIRIDEYGNETGRLCFPGSYEEVRSALPNEFLFVGAAVMVRREVLHSVGLYNQVFNRIGSEHLYWIGRIILLGKYITHPEYLYSYRFLQTSFSASNKKTLQGRYSKELAQIALSEWMKRGNDILNRDNERVRDEVIHYLSMKYSFWAGNYRAGLKHYFACRNSSIEATQNRKVLLKMYVKKWIKSGFGLIS